MCVRVMEEASAPLSARDRGGQDAMTAVANQHEQTSSLSSGILWWRDIQLAPLLPTLTGL